jgi:hypothetical protein
LGIIPFLFTFKIKCIHIIYIMTSAVTGEIVTIKNFIDGPEYNYALNNEVRDNSLRKKAYKMLDNYKDKLTDMFLDPRVPVADRNQIREFLPTLDKKMEELDKKVGGRKAYRKRKNTRRTKSRRVYTSKRR